MTAAVADSARDVMWRQARQLAIASLNTRLNAAIQRRDRIRVELTDSLRARHLALVDQFPDSMDMVVVLLARDVAVLGRVWDDADRAFRRTYDDIVKALRAQAASVPEFVL